ncbi:signal peptidase II [Paenibacillus marinisediminis]
MYVYSIALIVLLLDQGSKWLIATVMEEGDKIPVIGDFFLITSHRNTGAAFSMLEGKRLFFIVVTIIAVVGIIWYLQKVKFTQGKVLPIGLSLILGGALGNFVDRVITGEVVDFLQFNFGSYTFPIFNIADSAICIGVGLVLLDAFLAVRRENKMNEHQEGTVEEGK